MAIIMSNDDLRNFEELYELLKAKDIEGVGELINRRIDEKDERKLKAQWERLNDADREYVMCDLIIGFPFPLFKQLGIEEDEGLLEWALERKAEITFEKMKLERINEREKRQQTEELTEEETNEPIKAIAKGNKQWKN